MEAVSEGLDLFFDEFAKRTKEAPGWILLYAGIVAALLSDWVPSALKAVELRERSTIAALLAIAFLSLGDVLDSAVFPRQNDGTQWRNVKASASLAFSAFAGLWWLTKPPCEWLVPALTVFISWLLVVLVLSQVPRLVRRADKQNTGWPWLDTEALKCARKGASDEMHNIKHGIYQVSLELAKQTHEYEWVSCAWWQNEFGKLCRSLVFPLFAVSLIVWEQPFTFALAAVGVLIAFGLYWRLKVAHMCRLYATSTDLAKGPNFTRYPPHNVTNGEWVFFWEGKEVKVVGQGKV